MTIDVPGIVKAAGGEIIGKVRLQKTIFLLDEIGLNSGYTFEYHHYGPFSADLADQVEDDLIFGRLEAQSKRRERDRAPYVVYRASARGEGEPIDLALSAERVVRTLQILQKYSTTVLELAATVRWLSSIEGRSDWSEELHRRKGVKAEGGREKKALELLETLGIAPVS